MKKPDPQNPLPLEDKPDPRREPTLGEQLDALDSIARDVLTRIASDPVRRDTTHSAHADLSAVEVRIADLLVPLAQRRM